MQWGPVTITGGSLLPIASPLRAVSTGKASPRGSADCIIYLNLVGGPSQMDTFDFKPYRQTPDDFDVRTHKLGIQWPYGLLPRTAEVLDRCVITRSMSAWETFHNLAQYYLQVGHQFNAARAKELPSIGAVIAYELLAKAKPTDFLPPFISMNFPAGAVNGTLLREGYLPSNTAPLTLELRKGAKLPFLLDPANKERFNERLDLLYSFDTSRQMEGSGVNKLLREWDAFGKAAERMIKSPQIPQIFEMSEEERKRYGKSSFGDSCLIARNMAAARAGARYILVNQGGWDHHGDIYGKSGKGQMEDRRQRGGLYSNCGDLDPAFAALVEDLERMKLLDRTLIVVNGEFGRTPGPLTDILGRDHWPAVRSSLFAGGGVKGGRVIGSSDEQGGKIARFDWHQNRPMYPEDVTATIYSALGIDWKKKIGGTPSGREFQYVENMSGTTLFESTEIKELFA